MLALGFLQSCFKQREYLLPDIILSPDVDFYFFDKIISDGVYDEWGFVFCNKVLKYIEQLKDITAIRSLKLNSCQIEAVILNRVEKVFNLIKTIRNQKITYNIDDTSTWVDSFISIDWEGEEIYFSHSTPEGELLWSLYHSLEPLKKEIELGGSLCIVLIDE
ncbi:MAG TPA: hypothetical protein DCM08_03465 [Microscillaceae bacterium]|jgi:hypothetical protein|nr:hypothetical protein [Microscillaceae bacterium]